jgi:general secretion pathway protein G
MSAIKQRFESATVATAADSVARRRAQAGFTLVEIMIVVIIIGLLAAFIVPQYMSRVDEARVTKTKDDIQAISTALTLYRLDNFTYPNTEQGLMALVRKPNDPNVKNWKLGGYLQRLPKDPWGNDYQYAVPGAHGGEYDLYSFGADGMPGGDGVNADIGNWNTDK